MTDPTIAREVFYRGRVQGVGFRYTARNIAQRYAVKGFVRNLADGRVQLLALGAASEVNAFLAAVREAMEENIVDETIHEISVPDDYTTFEVRA
jgi:acylphosphatase